jgi:superfamily II DNA or RNA helicase/HKD family nuclease
MAMKQELKTQLLEEIRDLVCKASDADFSYYADRVNKTIHHLSQCYQSKPCNPISPQCGTQHINSDLLTRQSRKNILKVIEDELEDSEEVYIASAFISVDIMNYFSKAFERFNARGGRIRLLTSTMNSFNRPEVFAAAQKNNIDLRVFFPGAGKYTKPEQFKTLKPANFHLKCFLFKRNKANHSMIVGSSNFTFGGLKNNHEWNYFSNFEAVLPRPGHKKSIFSSGLRQFKEYWSDSQSIKPNQAFYEFYQDSWRERNRRKEAEQSILNQYSGKGFEPREAQREALENIKHKRQAGVKKTAVIAATGLGKTFLVAFDFKASGMKNILFIAHRENILRNAQKTFEKVCGEQFQSVILSGNTSVDEKKSMFSGGTSVFAMVQTLSKKDTLNGFKKDSFEYIVVDEFHHSEAATYRKTLKYFESDFFLGLTATPERMDGKDVLEYCNNDVAYENRLFEAIEREWLSPFQYYAIYDQTDYSTLRWTGRGYDEKELEAKLSTDTRVDLIANNFQRYFASSGKRKALAFCSNIGHAIYMSDRFNERGIPAKYVIGTTSIEEREEVVRQLQDENHELQVVCSVDVFGEGVDIPELSHILLLRPTQSFTVFLQQLGRGLRKTRNKEFCVILDFIGNFRKSFISPLGLKRVTDLTEKRKLTEDFVLPGSCFIDMDEQVKRIWDNEIKRILMPKNERERLIEIYNELRENMKESPSLMDFFANITTCDPRKFINKFGSWLQTKKYMDDLTTYERSMLNTSGESFLVSIEKGLRPNKSYKMVVLLYLLSTDKNETQWNIDDIAKWFKQFFLNHLEYLPDYKAMYDQTAPERYSEKMVKAHLLKMPLFYLSVKSSDCFVLDKDHAMFSLKPEYHAYWKQPEFRILVQDRVEYVLKRYFYEKDLAPDYQKLHRIYKKLKEPDLQLVQKQDNLISLPYYPDLKMACGTFTGGSSRYGEEPERISLEDPFHRLDPSKHFILRASGHSMNGGRSPIKDGDLLLMELNQGGSISNQIFGVQYEDHFGDLYYVLKRIEKNKDGHYTLVSANKNPEFKDIIVDPKVMKPFARFKYVLDGVICK